MMNHLMSICLILIAAVPISRDQNSNVPTGEDTPAPASQQLSPYRPAEPRPLRPLEPKRITIYPTGDAQESEVAMKFIAYFEKEGFATGKVAELSLTPGSPLRVAFIMRHDESHEKVKEFLTSLGDAGVERIFLETNENVHGGDEKNVLSFRAIPGYSSVEVERIENAAVSAAKSCGVALSLGGTYVKSWKPNGESATVPSLRPVELKRIAVFADIDEEPSEIVTRFLSDLESDGIANVEAKASAPAFRYQIQLNFVPKEDEPLEKIKQFIVALRQSGVEQINCDLRGHHGGQNTLLFTVIPGYSHEEQQRIENAARTAAEHCGLSIGLAGTMVSASDANARKITQLRTDYEAANKRARDLAESLRQTPDAAKKAELRTAVERAFTLRQSLLRAELHEMQGRLEKTQQSLDMRDRMVDEIVDRRVEDLLNPELKWDDEDLLKTKSTITSTLTAPTKPKTTASTVAELDGDWHRMSASGAETSHFNITIHGSTWTQFVVGKPEVIEFLCDTAKKTIEFKSTPPVVYTYQVHGDSLILHNETQTQAFNRDHYLPPDVTELEGDWRQMSSSTDRDGKPLAGGYATVSFRKNQYTHEAERGQHRCRVDVISSKKEIRYFHEGEYNFFVQDHYILEGDQLTIYDENRRTVYRRVKVLRPKSIPTATDEQKAIWRSGIVQIIVQQRQTASEPQGPNGYGVIVSPQGMMISQLKLSDGDWIFFARFDDGGVIPIKLVEEGIQGWSVFQPEQPINVNHHYRLSAAAVGKDDEVNSWAMPGNHRTLDLYKNNVTALDRKSPALGLTVWKLHSNDMLNATLPILDGNGDVLAISAIGTGDLSLAVPVSQLKAIFPKSLGLLTETEKPAEPAPIP